MGINNHKIVLIIGACDKKHRMNSYVAKTTNGTEIQLIDVTKDVNVLKTCDQSYFDYMDETVKFFIGDAMEKIDAVIFYSTEAHFNDAVIKKLNPACMVIHYSEANMTEREIIEHVGANNEQFKIKSEENNDSLKTLHVPELTNSQILSQGFAGFFVGKQAAVTVAESEKTFDIRWPV